MSKKDQFIELGFCAKPHGIKGAFTFNLISGENSVLKKGMTISLKGSSAASCLGKDGELYKIKKIQFGNKVIAELEGVNDRNRVEEMIPFSISLWREDFPKLKEGEFYLNDLIGYQVFDKEGADVGVVSQFGSNGAQDIICIKGKDGESIEVLFIEQFVVEIDEEASKIVINIPELI